MRSIFGHGPIYVADYGLFRRPGDVATPAPILMQGFLACAILAALISSGSRLARALPSNPGTNPSHGTR